MYDLLGMKERGVPVHGAGMQAHFTAAGTGQYRVPTPHSVQRNVRRLGELGLTVNISEMDVRYADVRERSSHLHADSDFSLPEKKSRFCFSDDVFSDESDVVATTGSLG